MLADNTLSLSAEEIATYCRDDLNFFASILIPEETVYSYPDFYREVWAFILSATHDLGDQAVFRFALGLPRGHVKTTLVKLLIVYYIIHDYGFTFFLIVCATEPLAENFMQDVHDILSSQIITEVYGEWEGGLVRDTKQVKRCNFLERHIIIAAIGAGTSLRGLNIKNRRPQLIVCDDVQTKENDESDTERLRLLTWLTGTLFKSRTKIGKSAILYIGNMYSDRCILNQFAHSENWTSLITGAILADGSALWPELNSIETLVEEFNHDNSIGLGGVWFAEVQNDPLGAGGGLLDPGQTVPVALDEHTFELDSYPCKWICIDPAGMKKESDDNVIGAHCLMEEGQVATFWLDNGKYAPDQVIDKTLRAAIRFKIPLIFIESNAYQGTLAFWVEKYLGDYNLKGIVKVIPIPSGNTSKFSRIKAWVKLLTARTWHLVGAEVHNKTTFQIYSYKVNKTNNVDDIIDENALALKALNEHRAEILTSQHVELSRAADIPMVVPNTLADALRSKLW